MNGPRRYLLFCLLIGLWYAGAASAAPRSIVDLRLAHVSSTCQGSAPVTFGQPFRPGDVPNGVRLAVALDGHLLPSQADIKSRNEDGSVRHAVISVMAPCKLDGSERLQVVAIDRDARRPVTETPSDRALKAVLSSGFDARLQLRMHGKRWQASAHEMLARVAADGGCQATTLYCRRWLSGPLVNEWVVGAPLRDDNDDATPQLMAFFAVRAYGNQTVEDVRVDTTLENDWAYAPGPGNREYDAALTVGDRAVQTLSDLTHYHHARWHQTAWWKHDRPAWFAALNGAYLQAMPAVPSYQSVQLEPSMMTHVRQHCAPMKHCDVMAQMGATGAQSQIGPLPQWSAAYAVATNDYRAYRWMLANSDALGAYSIHFREQPTGAPLSLARHPCVTTLGPVAEQSRCHAPPHGDDRFPHCEGCHTPLDAEPAHVGAPAYMAYLVTGDWYYAQELAFWADWAVAWQNPGYRKYATGLIENQQVRGQAWALRTLGYAAYALPDDAALKPQFERMVDNNIDWYTRRYINGPGSNSLGALTNGYAISAPRSGAHQRTRSSTWQMSFFTWSIGNLVDLGYDKARPLLNYFSRYQIGSLTSSGFCPTMASAYLLKLRDDSKAPLYHDFAEVYRQSFPDLVGLKCDGDRFMQALRHNSRYDGFAYPAGTMVGYPSADTGFVANYQIGLAAAANSDQPHAEQAWDWFMKRPVRPSYTHSPQFAIVPTP